MKQQLFKYVIILLAIFCLISCTKKTNWDTELNWERLDINNLPTRKDYPNAGAIILHDEATIENFGSEGDGWTFYSRHRIVKIFNIKGHQYANLAIPYSPRNEIEDLQARTISPSGKITVVNSEDIYDINLYPNFMLYSDQRSRLLTFPAIENGSIVEYRFNIRYAGHTFGNSWTFQDNIPVLYSKFEIQIPGDAEPVYKISGIDIEPTIKEAPEGFKAKYVWEAKNLEAIEPEIGMPIRKNVVARLKISSNSFKSWEEIGDWYRKLSEPQMTVSDELSDLVLKITKDKAENSEKLKAIYNWVNKNIRYIAVSIGIGSYQPHRASEVFKNRYGDCKDMTNLLCTMAKEANVDIYPALISTWQNGIMDSSIISTSQFNHVIAYYPTVGDEGIWMDATDKACGFNALPWYDQGRLVLAVLEDSSKFVKTSRLQYLSNRTKTEWEINLQPDGSAKITGQNRIWGAQANDRRFDLLMLTEKNKKKWFESIVLEKCVFTELDTMDVKGDVPIKDPLVINYKFFTERFANKLQDELVFCPGDFSNMNLADYFTEEERTYPIQFKYGMQQQYNFIINMPENWHVKSENVEKSVKSEFGEAAWRWYIKDNKLHIQNQFILKGDNVSTEEYPEFKLFLKEVRLQELEQMVLSEK